MLNPARINPVDQSAGISWFGKSIRTQVMLAVSLMLTVTAFAAVTVAVLNGRKAVNIEIEASMDFAEGYLRELVNRIAAENKLADLDYLVAREVQHLRHARVYIKDPNAEARLLKSERVADDDGQSLDDVPDWFESLMMPAGGDQHSRLILIPKGERSLLLKGDPDDEIAEKWRELSALAIIAVAALGLLVAAFYVVLGWILNPLVSLARGLEALEAGERSQRLTISGVGEVADITRNFNSLATSLDQARAENGELYRQIKSVQEDERREIARELHDEAGPCLFGITANAESISALVGKLREQDAAAVGKRVDEILSITDRLKAMNRALLKRLHPISIGKVPLRALITDLVCDFERRHPNVQINAKLNAQKNTYGEKVDLTVYRAAQEALTNAVRHGNASSIDVELADFGNDTKNAAITLRVSDDGTGFQSGTQIGFGLSAMKERVFSAGGSLTLEKNTSRGVSVLVKIPICSNPENRKFAGGTALHVS